jgi:hypothetical protein
VTVTMNGSLPSISSLLLAQTRMTLAPETDPLPFHILVKSNYEYAGRYNIGR